MSELVDQPSVCVLTPVYNTQAYLEECIQSVLRQDYPNWTYVIVNNCSTDGSREIAARYAEKDPRITLLDNDEFLDQIGNYNRALALCAERAEFCKIVQADDWIYPQCLTEMVRVAQASANVGLVSAYRLVGNRVLGDGLPVDRELFSGTEVCRRQLMYGDFFFGTPTTLMYRSATIRERPEFYDRRALHVDTDVCYHLLADRDFAFVHQVLSYSRIRSESITHQVSDFNPRALDKMLAVHTHGPAFLNEREYEEVRRRTVKRYYRELARSIVMIPPRRLIAYHSAGLSRIGLKLVSRDLVWAMLWVLADLLFNPKKSAGDLMRRLGFGRA